LKSHSIKATLPFKKQRVTDTFSAVQQDCLILKMETTRPFETSRTASQLTISNTADRTWNHTTVNPAVCLNFPIQLSLVPLTNCQLYSHCNCLQYCTVSNVYCMDCFRFNSWNFYSKERPNWSLCKKSAKCGPNHYVCTSRDVADYATKRTGHEIYISRYLGVYLSLTILPKWLVLRRHTNDMDEVTFFS